VELTSSFERVIPASVLERYTWVETRNAAAVLQASNPEQFADLVAVLAEFAVYDADILTAGGNRGQIAIRLDAAFEARGWDAVRVNTVHRLEGLRKSKLSGRAYDERFLEEEVRNEGFEVDNMKGRVALDVEWNAKDGNLDRDLAAYRALYDLGLVDVAAIVTRDHYAVRDLAALDLGSEDAARRLGTTTTTNMAKLEPRLTRGDAGGCPILGIGITRATWAGAGVPAPHVEVDDDVAALFALEQDADPEA
jgi:Restriction endonuclease BglII.